MRAPSQRGWFLGFLLATAACAQKANPSVEPDASAPTDADTVSDDLDAGEEDAVPPFYCPSGYCACSPLAYGSFGDCSVPNPGIDINPSYPCGVVASTYWVPSCSLCCAVTCETNADCPSSFACTASLAPIIGTLVAYCLPLDPSETVPCGNVYCLEGCTCGDPDAGGMDACACPP